MNSKEEPRWEENRSVLDSIWQLSRGESTIVRQIWNWQFGKEEGDEGEEQGGGKIEEKMEGFPAFRENTALVLERCSVKERE